MSLREILEALSAPTSIEEPCFTKTDLKSRGWTEASIRDFLGPPDLVKENKKYRNVIYLWRVSRVEEAESTEAFKEWLEKSKARREAASKRAREVAKKKTDELVATCLEAIGPKIEEALNKFTCYEELAQAALDHWWDLKMERSGWKTAGNKPRVEDISHDTMERWICNFIRHTMVPYERLLDQSYRKVGKRLARCNMQAEVLVALWRWTEKHPPGENE